MYAIIIFVNMCSRDSSKTFPLELLSTSPTAAYPTPANAAFATANNSKNSSASKGERGYCHKHGLRQMLRLGQLPSEHSS